MKKNVQIDMDDEMGMSILDQIPTPVMAINKDYEIIYMNRLGLDMAGKPWEELKGTHCYDTFKSKHCNTPQCQMRRVFKGEDKLTDRNEVCIGNKTIPIEYTADSLKDAKGNIIGGVEFIQDITEQVKKEQRIKEQSRTIAEISTPAIKLWDRVVIIPIVGVVDSLRAQQMMDTMLSKVSETSAKVIILDIQGVAAVDTAVANHLIKISKATKLMGCKCILSGISPAVAQGLVHLGIDLGDISSNITLQDALADAFNILELDVVPRKERNQSSTETHA